MSEAGDWQMNTVLQILWSFVVKRAEREIDFIFSSIYATLIYGNYLWIVTIRMKLKQQKSFLQRVTLTTFKDRLRISGIWESLTKTSTF